MSEPRTWVLHLNTRGQPWDQFRDQGDLLAQEIKVIEYSAFAELQEKLKVAEEALFCASGYVPHEHFDKENCTKCKIIKALEKIRGGG